MVVSAAQDRTFEGQWVPSAGWWNIDSSLHCAAGYLVVVDVQRRQDRVVGARSPTRAPASRDAAGITTG
jgi:hypothetical protein